ncbi:MAG TPA: hypothetical protein VJM15_07650 [Sphingomicrobium sp.]|nr:hypothetical protein [Sphingomicrobium sp.]
MTRLIAQMLLLAAVLLMPLGMAPAAGATSHHEAAMDMPMEHCPEQEDGQGPEAGLAHCMMACSAALPVAFASGEQRFVIICAPSERAAARILRGLHPETATPPPKRS